MNSFLEGGTMEAVDDSVKVCENARLLPFTLEAPATIAALKDELAVAVVLPLRWGSLLGEEGCAKDIVDAGIAAE